MVPSAPQEASPYRLLPLLLPALEALPPLLEVSEEVQLEALEALPLQEVLEALPLLEDQLPLSEVALLQLRRKAVPRAGLLVSTLPTTLNSKIKALISIAISASPL